MADLVIMLAADLKPNKETQSLKYTNGLYLLYTEIHGVLSVITDYLILCIVNQKYTCLTSSTAKYLLFIKTNKESSVLKKENPREFINYLGINRGKPFLSTLLSISICDQFLSVR